MRESGNKEPLVSVIVPIYNVVDFINRGIEFLFKQDFTDFEVLLIDDGSTAVSYTHLTLPTIA